MRLTTKLLVCYSYAEEPALQFVIECHSVEEAKELALIIKSSEKS